MSGLPVTNHAQALAALWAFVGRIAGKQERRELLLAGAAHECDVFLEGSIDGLRVAVDLDGRLTVGHDQTRASSKGPDQAHLLAVVLGKLNPKTREAIVEKLPEEFAANDGRLPDVSHALVEQAEGLLERLRAKIQTTAKGPVSVAGYTVAVVDPAEAA